MAKLNEDTSRRAASRLQNSRALTTAARAGYLVNGLLHMLIGGIALGVAFGGGGAADQGGALGQLAQNPLGIAVLWIVVAGMWALGLFQLLEAALVRGTDRDAWFDRAKEAGKGIAYLAIGATAFGYATGGGSDSSGQTQSLSAQLLASPGGVALLLALAAGVIAIGAYFVVKGARKRFVGDLRVPPGTAGRVAVTTGVVGYIAKGVAIAVVGVLFGVAAVTADPEEATGLDGALKSLAALPLGVAILTAVALGLIAYGIYCFFRARYTRL